MKCLFCGKDLPLLKRLSGAEFCSEEHRQQYQLEFSELALDRLAQNKSTGKKELPVKPPPKTEPLPSINPLGLGSGLKLTEQKPEPRRAASRGMAEPKMVPASSGSAKPAPVAKPSRPSVTSMPAAPQLSERAISERPRSEAKTLSVTPPSTRPMRSIVPLQENRPIRVTETKVTALKDTEPRVAEAKLADSRLVESEPLQRSHAPLRLELPVTPPNHASVIAERRGAPVSEMRSAEPVTVAPVPVTPAVEPAITAPAMTPVHEAPAAETENVSAANSAASHPAIFKKEEEKTTGPAPAGLVVSQPPHADWKAPHRTPELQMATVLMPVRPATGLRARAASLNGADHLRSTEIMSASAPSITARAVRLEIRDFARMEPVIDFRPGIKAPYVPSSDQAVPLSFAAAEQPAEPKLWAEPPREFEAAVESSEKGTYFELLTLSCSLLKESVVPQEPMPESPIVAKAGSNGAGPHIDLSGEPRPVTSAKPIALEGVPGNKAKPMQMFTSTLRESVQPAMAMYDALPLRPTMLVGPADSVPQQNGSEDGNMGGSAA